MSMGALIEKFRSVGLERIEQMNSLLVELERRPDDGEALDELMREIHTIKGEAKMMGFADINLVAHQSENLLLAAVDDETLVDDAPIDLIFQGFDLMRGLLTKSAGDSNAQLDLNRFVDDVASFTHGSTASAAEPAEQDGGPPSATASTESTSTGDSDLDEDEAHAPQDSTDISPDDIEAGDDGDEDTAAMASPADVMTATDDDAPTDSGFTTKTRIESLSSSRDDSDVLRIQTTTSLRVDAEKLERLGDLAGETLLMSRRLDYHLEELDEIRLDLRHLRAQLDDTLPQGQSRSLRDITHRIDACETSLREENYLVNLRASQVDEQARNLRHIPLAQVLSHYPRAVRDLADAQGKLVRLVHAFGNVEVDRTILDALSKPLLHLVRNAVDHGIESPEVRQESGKDPEGEISLRAEYFGDSIRVELTDDGHGINPEAIRAKAIERDFLPPEKAQRLSDQEAIALIFEPGFSTRSQVSDISGRGVGMNVVRRQITRIGGFIEVESEVAKGTTFTLHLPVSSAVNAVLVFAIRKRCFALTAKDVERVAITTPDQLRELHGGVCVSIGEELLPLMDWSVPLGLEDRGTPPEQMTILVVRKGARRIAVWVDDVIGEREAISRPLGDFLNGIALCRGIALTDSGTVVPLLNVVSLMEHGASDARLSAPGSDDQTRSFATIQSMRAPGTRTILVVEDSEITRSLVVSILRNQGYRVLEADAGHHGWNMLRQHQADLVLTDIQMPGMDGLELLDTIRNSDDYKHLPVIILTTLGEPEDKKRAMKLGASGYLVKLSFEEQDLLDIVEMYIG